MKPTFCYQHQKTTNDTNGNPRRLFVLFKVEGKQASLENVFEEGYCGRAGQLSKWAELPSVFITPAEYRATRRDAKERNKYTAA